MLMFTQLQAGRRQYIDRLQHTSPQSKCGNSKMKNKKIKMTKKLTKTLSDKQTFASPPRPGVSHMIRSHCRCRRSPRQLLRLLPLPAWTDAATTTVSGEAPGKNAYMIMMDGWARGRRCDLRGSTGRCARARPILLFDDNLWGLHTHQKT